MSDVLTPWLGHEALAAEAHVLVLLQTYGRIDTHEPPAIEHVLRVLFLVEQTTANAVPFDQT